MSYTSVARLVSVMLTVATVGSSQVTWYVDWLATPPGLGSVSQPFPTIGDAVGASTSGDIILVGDGNYPSFSFGGKNVTVVAQNGLGGAVIQTDLSSPALVAFTAGEGPAATLDGFVLVGDGAVDGVVVTNAAPTVRNCRIYSCVNGILSASAGASGAIGATFEDVLVRDCIAQQTGTPFVGVDVVGPATFRRCVLRENRGEFGPIQSFFIVTGCFAGLRVVANSFGSARFEDCVIAQNTGGATAGTTGAWGGAFVLGGEFLRCRFIDNSGGHSTAIDDGFGGTIGGTGGLGGFSGHAVLSDCVFAGNVGGAGDLASGAGGVDTGLFAPSGTPTSHFVNCTMVANSSPPTSLLPWRNCIIRSNGAPGGPAGTTSYCNIDGGGSGVGDFDAPPSFRLSFPFDLRLLPGSAGIDLGDPSGANLGATDPDGEPRIFGGRVDVGADEYTGALFGAAGAGGSVGDATGNGGPFDVLFVNGSAGWSGRQVDVAVGAPLTFQVALPLGITGPVDYLVCGLLRAPTAADAFPTPFGLLTFTPALVAPALSELFVFAGSIPTTAPPALAPTLPAPVSLSFAAGLPVPLTITLQGVLAAGGPPAQPVRTTNAVVLHVY